MAINYRSPAEAAFLRAQRRFRCRDCGALVRARWSPTFSERIVDDHGAETTRWITRCPGAGRLMEVSTAELRLALLEVAR